MPTVFRFSFIVGSIAHHSLEKPMLTFRVEVRVFFHFVKVSLCARRRFPCLARQSPHPILQPRSLD